MTPVPKVGVPASGSGSQSPLYAGFTTQAQDDMGLNYYLPTNIGVESCGYGLCFKGSTMKGQSFLLGYWPFSGYRNLTGLFNDVGRYSDFWSASPSGAYAFSMFISGSAITPTNVYNRSLGFSIRCVRE